MSDQVGKITFRSASPAMSFTCWIGQEGIKVTDGYGGWEVVNRPRQSGLTQWNGRAPLQMSVPIVIDGFMGRDSVELEVSILEKMSIGDLNDNGEPPPVITVSGPAVPHSKQDWVIEGATPGASIRKNSNGDLIRQEYEVVLRRHSAADKLQLSAAKRTRLKTKKQQVQGLLN
jgi:hypothetical protein